MPEPQISWGEHKTHSSEVKTKYSHHQKKRRRSSRFDERWKRSGAMTAHHGCDEHYRNRTCPGCQGDEDAKRGCGSVPGDFYFLNMENPPSYVLIKTAGEKMKYIDKDLGTVYYEKTLVPYDNYWYSDDWYDVSW